MGVSELRAIAKKLDAEDRAALLAEISALESKYAGKIRTKVTKPRQSFVTDRTERHFNEVREQYNRYVREKIDEKAKLYDLPRDEIYQRLYRSGAIPRLELRDPKEFKSTQQLKRALKYMVTATAKSFDSKQLKKAKTNLINAIGTFAPHGSLGDKFRHEISKMSREEWEKLNLENPEKIAQMWEFYHESVEGNPAPYDEEETKPLFWTNYRRNEKPKPRPKPSDLSLAVGQFEKEIKKQDEKKKQDQPETLPQTELTGDLTPVYTKSELQNPDLWYQNQAEIEIIKESDTQQEIVNPETSKDYYDYMNKVNKPSATIGQKIAQKVTEAIQAVGSPMGKAVETLVTMGTAAKHPEIARKIANEATIIGEKTANVTKAILRDKENMLKAAALMGVGAVLNTTIPLYGAVTIARTGRAVWKIMDGERVLRTVRSIKALGQII